MSVAPPTPNTLERRDGAPRTASVPQQPPEEDACGERPAGERDHPRKSPGLAGPGIVDRLPSAVGRIRGALAQTGDGALGPPAQFSTGQARLNPRVHPSRQLIHAGRQGLALRAQSRLDVLGILGQVLPRRGSPTHRRTVLRTATAPTPARTRAAPVTTANDPGSPSRAS